MALNDTMPSVQAGDGRIFFRCLAGTEAPHSRGTGGLGPVALEGRFASVAGASESRTTEDGRRDDERWGGERLKLRGGYRT